MATLTPC